MKELKEIEYTKEANGLTYILTGELVVDHYISPIREVNSADQSWEVDRYVSMPWLTVIENKNYETVWDDEAKPAQLRFFEDEIQSEEV